LEFTKSLWNFYVLGLRPLKHSDGLFLCNKLRLIGMVNTLTEKGLISRKEIKVLVKPNNSLGIRFCLEDSDNYIEANSDNIFSTQRNTVLAKNNDCICLTEHFLAAAALKKLTNIDVILSEPELPFGDGSAQFWIDFFDQLDLPQESFDRRFYKINENLLITDDSDESRFIRMELADNFSVTYLMDWNHPALGKQNYTWTDNDTISAIASARTFSSEVENELLGLSGWVLGYSDEGFKQDLHYENEPARHKALDLLGDLMLSTINPLNIKMSIVSSKAGHELNSKAAQKLKEIFLNG
jgi:UDP-3-O-acyl-N-acetylglucosamine deacetylase